MSELPDPTASGPPASVPDFVALRSCWHPVGYASELGDGPARVVLLDEPVVFWRDRGGATCTP